VHTDIYMAALDRPAYAKPFFNADDDGKPEDQPPPPPPPPPPPKFKESPKPRPKPTLRGRTTRVYPTQAHVTSRTHPRHVVRVDLSTRTWAGARFLLAQSASTGRTAMHPPRETSCSDT